MAYKRNSIEVPELEILLAGKKKKYVRYCQQNCNKTDNSWNKVMIYKIFRPIRHLLQKKPSHL